MGNNTEPPSTAGQQSKFLGVTFNLGATKTGTARINPLVRYPCFMLLHYGSCFRLMSVQFSHGAPD